MVSTGCVLDQRAKYKDPFVGGGWGGGSEGGVEATYTVHLPASASNRNTTPTSPLSSGRAFNPFNLTDCPDAIPPCPACLQFIQRYVTEFTVSDKLPRCDLLPPARHAFSVLYGIHGNKR
jgi:hypothetical protein